MIRNCGLLPKGTSGGGPDSPELLEAYELYRARDNGPDSERAKNFRAEKRAPLIPIKFLGVWDTVGALGIPLESFAVFNKEQFEFHDTELSGIVRNAFHAVAVDEHREPYRVALWDPKQKVDQTIEQRWFVGAHADVGGGYPSRALSDITLRWMQEKVQSCGLKLDETGIPAVSDANALGMLADSFKAFLGGVFSLFSKRYYRPVCMEKFGMEVVDMTVPSRMKNSITYRPKNPGLMDALKALLGIETPAKPTA
jgi:type VI secretion system (T6SS) phospholipase Tle1-like effector